MTEGHGRHERLQLCARSDKKFGERESSAECQPTILRFSPIWKSGPMEPCVEWNHNPNRPLLFLEKFEETKIGDLWALPEKLEN